LEEKFSHYSSSFLRFIKKWMSIDNQV
jgi:hypothetical protein